MGTEVEGYMFKRKAERIKTHGWEWSLAGAACAVIFTLAIIFNIL